MIPALPLAYFGAALIAMGAALFGVGTARVFWADDLKFTLHLKQTWDQTNAANERSIAALQDIVRSKDEQIAILQHSH